MSVTTADFPQYQGLIISVARKSWEQFGGDLDDLISEGYMIFLKAVPMWNKDKHAKFSTYLAQCVHNRMIHYGRMQARRRMIKLDRPMPAPANRDFEMAELMETLSPDAKHLVEICLDPPPAVQQEADAKGGHPRNIRGAAREYLHYTEKWSRPRIAEAVQEVQHALCQ